jgi:2-polyprenyl-6-methoxyphenol hydroxylase-like FAD-dependent oxidoreductase
MKVLICGAGIAGLTLATCLERRGDRVVVVESAPTLGGHGCMLDLFGSGYDAIDKLGLLPELQSIHCPIKRFVVVDGNGKERLSLPYSLVRKRLFHDRHLNLMRDDLNRLLADKIAGRAEIRFGTTVETIEQKGDHLRVRLSDGSTEELDLLVGADGVHSRVRRLAFGGERGFARFLGCYAAAFVVREPPRGLDIADSFVTLTVPGRQVAVQPIPGGGVATLFVHRGDGTLADLSNESAVSELYAAYGSMGWIVPELLKHASEARRIYFDTVSQIEMSHWSVGRVVLIGDACQSASIWPGQGASTAVAGAYVLTEELDAESHHVANALVGYERRLKPTIEHCQTAGRRMAEWLVPESKFQLALRDVGLRMSVWPIASTIARKHLAAESIFRS